MNPGEAPLHVVVYTDHIQNSAKSSHGKQRHLQHPMPVPRKEVDLDLL